MSFAGNQPTSNVLPRHLRYLASGTIAFSDSPRVLLVTACRWPSATRLALALSQTGIVVEALCPTGHSLTRAKFVSTVYRYRQLSPAQSLRAGIEASRPDFIIPTDDIAVGQLHRLYKAAKADPAGEKMRLLMAYSLGDPVNYSIFFSRAGIAALAHSIGVPSPTVIRVLDESDLQRHLEGGGYPAVLKSDGSSGGLGVAIVNDRNDAKRAFEKLSAPPSVALTLKRLIVDRDANLVLPCLRRTRVPVSVQRFITGRRANVAAACWNGKVLAQVCVEVLSSNSETSSSTVVRVIAHPGMSDAVQRLVGALKLSGLCGLDFILDSNDDRPYLIDFNPRATQTCHLVSSDGKELVGLLAAELRGLPAPDHLRNPQQGPIVLFPHGFVCDPNSPYSQYIHTDLPPGSPEFIKFGLEFRQEKNRFLAKALRHVRERYF